MGGSAHAQRRGQAFNGAMFTVARLARADINLPAHVRFIQRDAPFHAFVAAYAVAGLLTAQFADLPHKFAPLTDVFYGLPLVVLAIVIGGVRRARAHPTPPECVAAALLFFSLLVHMGVFTSIQTMLPHTAPSRHFGVWSVLVPACLLACLFSPRLRPVRDRCLWTYLLLWPLLGNVVAALGAAPSMHLASATVFVLLASRIDRRLMDAALVVLAAFLLWSVHLDWRYALNDLISVAVTVHVWAAVGRALEWRARAIVDQ